MSLLEYEIDLYKNRYRLGVPSRFMDRAEEMLPQQAFQEFLENVNGGVYSRASSAFAKAVKDNNVEVTDRLRNLHALLKRNVLSGEDDFIPDWAMEGASVRQQMIGEAKAGILSPEDIARLEQKVTNAINNPPLLVKLSDRTGVSPAQLEEYLQDVLNELSQLMQVVS